MWLLQIFLAFGFSLFLNQAFAQSNDCHEAVELFNRGTQSRDLQEKENLYKEALHLFCEDSKILSKIHNNLADAYENQSKLKEAVAEYRKSIDLDPSLPTPYVSLGDVYSKLKDYKSAEEYYKKYGELTHFKTKERLLSVLKLPSTRGIKGIRIIPKEDLYFGFNETILTRESEKQLQELLAAISEGELRNYSFNLTGHTCDIGSDIYNQRLSERRAAAVKAWLVKNGYPPDRLTVSGFGKKKPLADNNTEEGRKLNRRVEIRTIGWKD